MSKIRLLFYNVSFQLYDASCLAPSDRYRHTETEPQKLVQILAEHKGHTCAVIASGFLAATTHPRM
jgi:hypothetical protein